MTTYRRSAIGPVQAAVYQQLSSDATLTALAPVLDDVPEPTPYPCVVIGEIVEVPDNSLGEQGRDIQVTVFAFSQAHGFLQLEGIIDRIWTLLDEDALADANPTQGWSNWSSEVVRSEVSRVSDGITRQVAIQVKVGVARNEPGE